MTDIMTSGKRSLVMSKIKGKNTKIERILFSKLKQHKLKVKLHHEISGRPDFVIVKDKFAVFVDGCFWHKCPRHFIKPSTRRSFWINKINNNVKRDRKINSTLRRHGWKVSRFWEHDVEKNPDKVVTRILDRMKGF